MAEAVAQLLEDMRIHRPHVVGYSLGARIALALTLRTGGLLCPPPDPYAWKFHN